MPEYRVEFKGAVFATDTVRAEDESDAVEEAFRDGDFPGLCTQCSGWGKRWSLETPDDPACWEVSSVTAVDGEPSEGGKDANSDA